MGNKMMSWRKTPVRQWVPLNCCGWLWSIWRRQALEAAKIKSKQARDQAINYRDRDLTVLHDADALHKAAAFVVKYRITGRMMTRFDSKMWVSGLQRRRRIQSYTF